MFLSFLRKLVVTKKTVSSLRDCLIAKGSMETTGPPSILKYSALSIELARLNSPDKFSFKSSSSKMFGCRLQKERLTKKVPQLG